MTIIETVNKVDLSAIEKRIPELPEMMDIVGIIGSGTFATVYLCKLRDDPGECEDDLFAVKIMLPIVNPKRIETETGIMYKANGESSVMPLLYDMLDTNTGTSALVMPYFQHVDFSQYFDKLELFEIQWYIHGLLNALTHLNKLGIVHRDVKPANYLFQRTTLQGQLTDFGLSEYLNKTDVYSTNKISFDDKCFKSDCINSADSVCIFCIAKPAQRVSRSGSPGFRAPEILIKSHRQDGMIDVWAAGICLLSTLARRYPFFPRADDFDALIQIGALVGSESLTRACKALNKNISISFLKMPEESQLKDSVRALRANSWKTETDEDGKPVFATPCEDDTATPEFEKALDLLGHLLDANPFTRFSASETLEHDFFKYFLAPNL
ncbi:unnamed protein product [Oikopleura dioica]|uniref:non-specific serine/threonine protein kinase n=1 Tax=Oikopleura dioica TaxID=34765 RepID=E4Y6P6_OIKDI|nr:unnamed protein product [Oikopleura dioica]